MNIIFISKRIVVCASIYVSVFGIVNAQAVDSYDATISSFKMMSEVPVFSIKIPKVVELVVPDDTQAPVLVSASGSRMFTPSMFTRSVSQADRPSITVTQGFNTTTINNMTDGDFLTYQEFYYDSGRGYENTAGINFSYDKPITTSSLTFTLDTNVILPETISVLYKPTKGTACRQKDTQGNCLLDAILPSQKVTSTSIVFPKVTATEFQVIFAYKAPLRISEISFDQENKKPLPLKVRFLALPDTAYNLYMMSDRNVTPQYSSSMPNLSIDDGVYHEKKSLIFSANSVYKQVDTDNDGLPDITDNCPSISNTDQKDEDGNGKGDACEDYDRDGYINSLDNCPLVPNYDQADKDRDGKGDLCDKEESRFLEANRWVPWVALGVSGVVILGLFAHVLKSGLTRRDEEVQEGKVNDQQKKD